MERRLIVYLWLFFTSVSPAFTDSSRRVLDLSSATDASIAKTPTQEDVDFKPVVEASVAARADQIHSSSAEILDDVNTANADSRHTLPSTENMNPAHNKGHHQGAIGNFLSSSLDAPKNDAHPYGTHVARHDGSASPTDPASLRHHKHKTAGANYNNAGIALSTSSPQNVTKTAASSSTCPPTKPPLFTGGAELEVPCGCEFDPGAPEAYTPATGSHASTPRILVFNAGGMALGNALLGYLTTYHDALRSGRAIVLARSGLISGALSIAFDLGLPWVKKRDLEDRPQAQIFFDYAQTPCPACVSYLQSGFRSPRVAGTRVAHSRPRNFHFDRSDRYAECYYRSLGQCPKPEKAVNTAKQEENPVAYCGESLALRRLIKRPSDELRRLSPLYEAHWNGSPDRLAALMSKDMAARGGPIWAVAIHVRVQFKFVEDGVDERSEEAVAAVQSWLGKSATKAKLTALVKEVVGAISKQRSFTGHRRRQLQLRQKHSLQRNTTSSTRDITSREDSNGFPSTLSARTEMRVPSHELQSRRLDTKVNEKTEHASQHQSSQAVYVASETALVRRHVADLLRAQGVMADYVALSGTAHPVDKQTGKGRFVQYEAVAPATRSNTNHSSSDGFRAGAEISPSADDERKADALFPYLEWWALAHSKTIVVRRGEGLSKAPSTYSGTAHLYGGWSSAHSHGRVPQFDDWPNGAEKHGGVN
jgi:hypothetical protein